MKRKILIAAGILLTLLMVYFAGTGFIKNPSVFVEDYTVSVDGREITLQLGVSSSAGYIRKVSVHRQDGNRLELDCYSAFGGVNGSIGARRTVTVPLTEDTGVIAFYIGQNYYEDVLIKYSDGTWHRTLENMPSGGEIPSERTFRGTITEIENGSMLVKPVEGSWELTSSDVFRIPIENMPSSPEPEIGDEIEVIYSGCIEELYPALLGGITSIRVIKDIRETPDETFTEAHDDTGLNLLEFSPGEIHDLVSAEINEDFGTFTLTDEDSLRWLTELLGTAEELKGWPNCPFEATISLKRSDGTTIDIQPATDSCTNYKVGDVWYSYEAVDNRELFALFGLKTEVGKVTAIEK